jgi:hypothetical protein
MQGKKHEKTSKEEYTLMINEIEDANRISEKKTPRQY